MKQKGKKTAFLAALLFALTSVPLPADAAGSKDGSGTEKPAKAVSAVKGDIDLSIIKDPYAFQREFDYFDRNETMDKNVFICVGEKEDIEVDCGDGDDMVEGSKALYERLKAHGANVELKIYEGCFHTNYIRGMMTDYLKQNFPPENKSES